MIWKLKNSFWAVDGQSRGEQRKFVRKIVNSFQGNSVVCIRECPVACDSLFGLDVRQWFGKASLWTKQWLVTKLPSRCVHPSQPIFLGCELSFLWLMELRVQPEGHSASPWADSSSGGCEAFDENLFLLEKGGDKGKSGT